MIKSIDICFMKAGKSMNESLNLPAGVIANINN